MINLSESQSAVSTLSKPSPVVHAHLSQAYTGVGPLITFSSGSHQLVLSIRASYHYCPFLRPQLENPLYIPLTIIVTVIFLIITMLPSHVFYALVVPSRSEGFLMYC